MPVVKLIFRLQNNNYMDKLNWLHRIPMMILKRMNIETKIMVPSTLPQFKIPEIDNNNNNHIHDSNIPKIAVIWCSWNEWGWTKICKLFCFCLGPIQMISAKYKTNNLCVSGSFNMIRSIGEWKLLMYSFAQDEGCHHCN